MSQSKHRIIAWVMVVAWAIVIFFMSSNTGDDLSDPEGLIGMIKALLDSIQVALFGPDVDLISSVAHFVEYTVLGALLLRALWLTSGPGADAGADDAAGTGNAANPGASFAKLILIAVAIASLYGVSDEIHQLFVPGRFCDPVDWAVDTAGALVGALICSKFLRIRTSAYKM